MAEKIYKSAGVFATETDLSQPSSEGPTGIPAGVIGTSTEGPAFVPITVGPTFSAFTSVFGATDGKKFGPMAVYTFLNNANALTYLKVLGAGDGKKRSASTGKVNRAGFTVGGQMIQDNGIIGANPKAVPGIAGSDTPGAGAPAAGRTYFLGCFMSESAGSTVFQEAGLIKAGALTGSVPIVRAILMCPSGVMPRLSCSFNRSTETTSSFPPGVVPPNVVPNHITASSGPANELLIQRGNGKYIKGGMSGTVNLDNDSFVLLLNGHKATADSPNMITASFNSTKAFWLGDNEKINRDPYKIQEKGHYLYYYTDINPAFAVVTGSGVLPDQVYTDKAGDQLENCAFITSGSAGRDTAAIGKPNYESFQERFQAAKTPFFISQDFGGTRYNLFRIHARGDGAAANSRYKISIQSIAPKPTAASNQYGTFEVVVRDFRDGDDDPQIYETWPVNLDPSSEQYIGRVIGDRYTYYDFDQDQGSQKLVVKGNFAGRSSRIRVEIPRTLELGRVPAKALPLGFRGPDHLVTSGTNPLASITDYQAKESIHSDTHNAGEMVHGYSAANPFIKRAVELPLRFRKDIRAGISATTSTIGEVDANANLFWGVQFRKRVKDNIITDAFGVDSLRSLNESTADFDQSMIDRTLFFPQFNPSGWNFVAGNNAGEADYQGTILDSDKFNNSMFTLERLRVKTGSLGDIADSDIKAWGSASYVRDGTIATDVRGMRAFSIDDLNPTIGDAGNQRYAKYSVFMQGGFDGHDIFNRDRVEMTSAACKREIDDELNQGGRNGPTIAAYRKAIDIMGVKSDVEINLLAIPGIRHSSVTDYAISAVENRFDAFYVMDIEQRDSFNKIMTGSKDAAGVDIIPSTTYTAAGFTARGLNSSFAAAYWPDINIDIGDGNGLQTAPASVAALGVMSQNDDRGEPWFAPAGYTRGTVDPSITGTTFPLEREDLNKLYSVSINPLATFAGKNAVVWGQKTLLANASALDRINVRRLLINIRRQVKAVANSMLFEPNRQETLDRFNALVRPIMQRVQNEQGVERYKVIIDTTTTTAADVENNTIRGKIYLQPTRTAEFIALDFTVANASNFDSV